MVLFNFEQITFFLSHLSDSHCVYQTVSEWSPCSGRPLYLESLKVESDLADVGADGLDGVSVGGRGGGAAGVARVPDVSVVPRHNLITITRNLKYKSHYHCQCPPLHADHDDIAADPDAIAACGHADPTPGGALGGRVTLPRHPLHVRALVVREVDDGYQTEAKLLLLPRDVVSLLDGDCGQVG